MEIKINENIYYRSFKTKTELREVILKMIMDNKLDKILYKGNPAEINYKLLKKIITPKIVLKNNRNINPDDVRLKYSSLVNQTNCEDFCIIYKK